MCVHLMDLQKEKRQETGDDEAVIIFLPDSFTCLGSGGGAYLKIQNVLIGQERSSFPLSLLDFGSWL